MALKVILVSLIGALLSLDRVLIQTMISRPIVSGPLTGVILGDAYTGLVIGSFLELLWIDHLPLGGHIPPNETLVTVLATSAALMGPLESRAALQETVAFSLLFYAPFAYLGKRMEGAIINSNEIYVGRAFAYAQEGNWRGIDRLQYRSIIKTFFANFVFLLLSLLAGIFVIRYLLPVVPLYIRKSLLVVYLLLPILGVSAAMNALKIRRKVPVFCALFLLLTIFWEIIHGL